MFGKISPTFQLSFYFRPFIMHKYFLLLFVSITGFFAFGQTVDLNLKLRNVYTVIDSGTKLPVPYATLYNHLSGKGTVTNLKGQFNWPTLQVNDTLTLSFVGYTSQNFTSTNPIPDTIYFQPKTEILQSAYVYGNMTFLYQLIADCKEPNGNKVKQAKTFLSLGSVINEQTIEKMEAYYNGSFNGYDCQELSLKSGRLSISNFGDRFFISTETTKALYLHKLYNSGSHFPTGPMGLNRKKLSKLFSLQFVKSYVDENEHTIYQINYTPTSQCEDCFYGTLWVDSIQHQIQRVTLFTDSTKRHPFIPIGHSDSLLNVSLEITKNYLTAEKNIQFKSTDFNYQLVYKTTADSIFKVKTNALIYAFDHQNTFKLPHFEYGNIRYQDYILIGSLPYNDFFWQNYSEFKMAYNQKDSRLFRSLNPVQTGTFVNTNNPYFQKPFFEHAYKQWSIKRIRLNQILSKEVKGNVPLEAPPSQQYKLKTQIYLDINNLNDSLHFTTSSYFDPYYSFFYLPQTNTSDAFVNMYFDLTEIKRREFVEKAKKAKSKQQIEALYQQSMDELSEQHKNFIKETQRGSHTSAMVKWNTYIYERLKIDNVELFQLLKK